MGFGAIAPRLPPRGRPNSGVSSPVALLVGPERRVQADRGAGLRARFRTLRRADHRGAHARHHPIPLPDGSTLALTVGGHHRPAPAARIQQYRHHDVRSRGMPLAASIQNLPTGGARLSRGVARAHVRLTFTWRTDDGCARRIEGVLRTGPAHRRARSCRQERLADFWRRRDQIEPVEGGDPLRNWRLLREGTFSGGRCSRATSARWRSICALPPASRGARTGRQTDVLIEISKPGTLEGWGLGLGCAAPANPS